jgi:hypothetical protein
MANEFTYQQIGRRQAFQVFAQDGRLLGEVKRWKVPHLSLPEVPYYAWEATGVDAAAIARFGNDHRGEHDHRDQAAKALAWDGKEGYPFPMKHRA